MSISVTSPYFLAALTLLALALVVVTARAERRMQRGLMVVVALASVLCVMASAVNAYFDYYPSLASVLGRSARDQAGRRELRRRELAGRHHVVWPSPPGVAVRAIGTGRARGADLDDRSDAVSRPHPVHGLVETVVIPATTSGFRARAAEVYLPPAWFESPRPQLPVIELLHGTPGSPADWTRAGGADLTADHFASQHAGVAPIIVMPDINGSFMGDTECVDTPTRHAETYLAVDVPTWVEHHLGASSNPSSWAIAGSSEGGYCALDLALRHPDRWATFADFAGLDAPTYPGGAIRHLFGGSTAAYRAHLPSYLLRPGVPRPAVAGWFEAGSADPGARSVERAAAQARGTGVTSRLVEVRGARHDWRFFRRSLADSFPWLTARLGVASSAHTV